MLAINEQDRLVCFNINLLFTNIPITKIIKIISDIYNKSTIKNKFTKTIKKHASTLSPTIADDIFMNTL